MKNTKIVFLGTPSYVDPIINELQQKFDLIRVIRSTDENLTTLKDLNPDIMIVASFGKIIPQSVLDIPKLGTINIHPSALPKYRGPSPIQYQILDGVTDSAVTFILMDSDMDHGPILKQIPFKITEDDTFESLVIKMFSESANYIAEVVNNLVEGKTELIEQAHNDATYTKMIKKESGYFEIDHPPSKEKLERMIRAYYPWPGVWIKWNEKIVKFLPNNMIQMEGKKAVSINDFLNGYKDFPLRDYLLSSNN